MGFAPVAQRLVQRISVIAVCFVGAEEGVELAGGLVFGGADAALHADGHSVIQLFACVLAVHIVVGNDLAAHHSVSDTKQIHRVGSHAHGAQKRYDSRRHQYRSSDSSLFVNRIVFHVHNLLFGIRCLNRLHQVDGIQYKLRINIVEPGQKVKRCHSNPSLDKYSRNFCLVRKSEVFTLLCEHLNLKAMSAMEAKNQ